MRSKIAMKSSVSLPSSPARWNRVGGWQLAVDILPISLFERRRCRNLSRRRNFASAKGFSPHSKKLLSLLRMTTTPPPLQR